MKRTALLAVVVLLATPTTALAQGSGTSRGEGTPGNSRSERAFGVDRTIQGRVVQSFSNRLIVEDEYGTRHTFAVTQDARFRADQRSRIGHLSNLQLTDFAQGIEVRVTFDGAGIASRVEARRPKTESTRGTILEVDEENGLLVIQTEDGEQLTFSAFPGTKFKRDKRSALAERSEDELEITDYIAGTAVKFEFRVSDNGLTELKAEGL